MSRAEASSSSLVLGPRPLVLRGKGPGPDLEDAFSVMVKGDVEALVILEVPVTIPHQKRITELAAMHRLPTMFPGGFSSLITLGTTILDTLPRRSGYVHKILNGAKPGELRIEITTPRELIFNLKTARALG